MALYLGSDKVKLNLGDTIYVMNIFSALPTIEDFVLSSSDDCILKDFNGLYLVPKEEN